MAEKRRFLLWGASGHAKVLDEAIRSLCGEVIVLVDNQEGLKSPLPGVPLIIGQRGYETWLKENEKLLPIAAIAAIGGCRGLDRLDYMALFHSGGLETPMIIHPTAHVCDTSVVAENCQVLAFAMLGPDSVLGAASILNTKASVDHECFLGKGVHVAPGATLCGCVCVGDYSFIGAGATVLPRIIIGSNVIVGAGSVVTKDIPSDSVVVGNPACKIRENPIPKSQWEPFV